MVPFEKQKWLQAIENEVDETTTHDSMEDEVQTIIDMMEVIGALNKAIYSIKKDISQAYDKAVLAQEKGAV